MKLLSLSTKDGLFYLRDNNNLPVEYGDYIEGHFVGEPRQGPKIDCGPYKQPTIERDFCITLGPNAVEETVTICQAVTVNKQNLIQQIAVLPDFQTVKIKAQRWEIENKLIGKKSWFQMNIQCLETV